MKISQLSGLLVLMMLPGLAYAGSYAPLADFSKVSNKPQCQLTTSMHQSFLKKWTPPAKYFKIPVYSNAVLVSAIPSGTAKVQGKNYRTFPSAILLSPDSPAKIISFYKQILGVGWFQANDADTMYIYRMPRPVNSGQALTQQLMSKPGYIPYIALDTGLGPCDQLLGNGARTRITVVAAPR